MLVKGQIPYDKGIDSTIKLIKEGYLFITNRIEAYESDVFETRLMGKKMVCISGKQAAKLFYTDRLFKRQGALPKRVQKTLFGMNGVQTMDGRAHLHRKKLFMMLMTKEREESLGQVARDIWEKSIRQWEKAEEIVLFDEARAILCEAVCQWVGVPLEPSKIREVADDFRQMIYGFGSIGIPYWQGKMARKRTEKWIKGVIEDVRSGKLKVDKGLPLYTMSFHKELDGTLMDSQVAAVELINVLRPTVAVATFITFAALALYEHPECKEKLASGDTKYLQMFAQEVRRYYPFAPFVGAKVRKSFIWNDYVFKKGRIVLLDIYGIDHDARIWEEPYTFYPERFEKRKENIYDFIPQGGGNSLKGHRCPGEGITLEMMKVSIDFLVNKIKFNVPNQDLSYSLNKIPTLPKSGFRMNHIRCKG